VYQKFKQNNFWLFLPTIVVFREKYGLCPKLKQLAMLSS